MDFSMQKGKEWTQKKKLEKLALDNLSICCSGTLIHVTRVQTSCKCSII